MSTRGVLEIFARLALKLDRVALLMTDPPPIYSIAIHSRLVAKAEIYVLLPIFFKAVLHS